MVESLVYGAKLLSLNCFGLWLLTSNRETRVEWIADLIVTGQYDLVCLQELFVPADYKTLCHRLDRHLPYSYWFTNSSVVGSSGLAIFSRWTLNSVYFLPFTVSGNPYKVYHGDYYAGKGVAYANITLPNETSGEPGTTLHLFNTHTHASYSYFIYQYDIHQLCQIYEIVRLVEHICGSDFAKQNLNCQDKGSLLILAGDFNTFQSNLAYRLIITRLAVFDCHRCNDMFPCNGIRCRTHQHPSNTFTCSAIRKQLDTISECNMDFKIDYAFIRAITSKRNCFMRIDVFCDDGFHSDGQSITDHQPISIKFAFYNKSPSQNSPQGDGGNRENGNNSNSTCQTYSYRIKPKNNNRDTQDSMLEAHAVLTEYLQQIRFQTTVVTVELNLISLLSFCLCLLSINLSSLEIFLTLLIHIIILYILCFVQGLVVDRERKAIETLLRYIQFELNILPISNNNNNNN